MKFDPDLEPAITATPLRRCRIYYMAAGQDLSWNWCSEDGGAKSREFFPLFFACVEDARLNGYYVDLERQPESVIHMQASERSSAPTPRASPARHAR